MSKPKVFILNKNNKFITKLYRIYQKKKKLLLLMKKLKLCIRNMEKFLKKYIIVKNNLWFKITKKTL